MQPAFLDVAQSVDPTLMSPDVLNWIGVRGLSLLLLYNKKVDILRRTHASTPPTIIQGSTCVSPRKCGLAWQVEWTSSIAFNINHPSQSDGRWDLAKITRRVVEIQKVAGMCSDCFRETIKDIASIDAPGMHLRLVEMRVGAMAMSEVPQAASLEMEWEDNRKLFPSWQDKY